MNNQDQTKTESGGAVASSAVLGHCVVCGSDMLLEFWRGHPDNKKIHCNHCGSEVAPWMHNQKQPQRRGEVPAGLKAEISRLIKDAFDCGFNAHTESALQHFDGFALADAALEQYWPNDKVRDRAT